MKKQLVFKYAEVEPFTHARDSGKYLSRLLVDREGVGAQNTVLNHFSLLAGKSTEIGHHPAPYEETYFILKGHGTVALRDNGLQEYDIGPGTVVFIPAGMDHSLCNTGHEELELLTIMPFQPVPGVNPIYDERKKRWGTSFRMKGQASE